MTLIFRAPDFITIDEFYEEVIDNFEDGLLAWKGTPLAAHIIDVWLQVDQAIIRLWADRSAA